MRWIASVLIACLFLAARGEVVAGAEGADAAKIAEWIAQLGADEFEIREAASQRLENVAEENSEAIFAALAVVKDPEIRQRLARLAHLIQPGKTVLHFDGCSVTGVGVPCVSDGRVYVPCRDHFFCFDALDGRKVWTCDRVGFTFEGPAVADGRVFFHCMRRDEPHDGTLYCLNAADGREEWKLEGYPSGNFTSPIAVNGHVFFGAGELLVSVDAKTGKEEWRFKAATTWLSTPTVADGKVLAGSVKGSLYCVSEADGKLLWEYYGGGSLHYGISVENGRVYPGGLASHAMCLNLADGKVLWKHDTSGAVAMTPTVAHGKLYVCSGHFLYCLNAVDGSEVWKVDAGDELHSLVIVCGDRVFASSWKGSRNQLCFFCFNASDGRKLWDFTMKSDGYVPILSGRRMFMGHFGQFLCIRIGSAGPKNWPMSGGNPARTGCNDK